MAKDSIVAASGGADVRRNGDAAPHAGPWRLGGPDDLKRLHAWYREPHAEPFLIEIAGPTPSFDLADFSRYCRDQAAFWVRDSEGGCDGLILLTYIQPTMRVANLDLRMRSLPEPGSAGAAEMLAAIQAACAHANVLKAQLLALAGEPRRLALAESLGFVREGLLTAHFYHAGAYHDLVMLGRCFEAVHG